MGAASTRATVWHHCAHSPFAVNGAARSRIVASGPWSWRSSGSGIRSRVQFVGPKPLVGPTLAALS